MLDVEFLANPKPNLRQAAIYTYRSGFLRSRVLNKVRAIWGDKGLDAAVVEPAQALEETLAPSLFGPKLVCVDFDAKCKVDPGKLFKAVADKTLDNSLLFMADASGPAASDGGLSAASKSASSLDEPAVTKGNVERVLKYFAADNKTFDFSALVNFPELVEAFQEYIRHADYDLASLYWRLDDLAVTCIDVPNSRFDWAQARRLWPPEQKPEGDYLWTELQDVLYTRSWHKACVLVRRLTAAADTYGPRAAFRTLVRATRDLSTVNQTLHGAIDPPAGWSPYKFEVFMKNRKPVPAQDLFFWHLVLLRCEPDVVEGCFSLQLLRAFKEWSEQAVANAG